MDVKGVLKAITLELRHELEGKYDTKGGWQPGDLERRLAAIGVRRDRDAVPVDELRLAVEDRNARRVIDAFLQSRAGADEPRETAIAQFVREAAYTWANRVLALRCMEARSLIDEVILQKDAYGGRSLQHNRLAKKQPERCAGQDEGLFAALFDEFARRAEELPLLFDPRAPEVALRPSVAALKRCVALLSGTVAVKGHEVATDEVFTAPDALGWTYQYWDSEEKNRVYDKVRTNKGFKIEGADIIPATCIYTEPYMVKFLVQNSLGALWMSMHPASRLTEQWEYFVRDADRAPASNKAIADVTFLDPACGSGHFLIEAFELFYVMYLEEGTVTEPAQICASILERNLFGIDIDERAVQIAALALVMKAKEKAPDFVPRRVNLVATNIRLPVDKEHLEVFLRKHPEDAPLKPALLTIFEGLAHADELGSLLQIEEPVEEELRALKGRYEEAGAPLEQQALWGEYQKPVQGKLPIGVTSYEHWKDRALSRLREHFEAEVSVEDLSLAFFGDNASRGISLVELLSRRYSVVAANPPYLGSKNMGVVLKRHIQKYFIGAKRDLFAAFILRCLQLSGGGRTAMVTQQSWMFLKQMHRIRAAVLATRSVEVIGHLGPGAFEEVSGHHVNVALFVASGRLASQDHQITAVRTSWDSPVSKRSLELATGATKTNARARFRVAQSALASLPAQPFVYWCSSRLLELLRSKTTYEAIGEVGYTASANQRFVRFHWEVPTGPRWRRYSKGGGFRRWAGLDWYVVDWESGGERPAAFVREHYAPDKYSLWLKSEPTATPTIVWSEIGSGAMGARLCESGTVVSRKGPGIMGQSESQRVDSLALLNARVSTHLLRITCSGLEFAYPYVAKLHRPVGHVDANLVHLAVELSAYLATLDPCERGYRADAARLPHANAVSATLSAVEAVLDDKATALFEIDEHDRRAVEEEVGVNAGSLPLVEGFDALPNLPDKIQVPDSLKKALAAMPRRSGGQASELAALVRGEYAKASGDRVAEPSEISEGEQDIDEHTDDDGDVIAVHPPIPAATPVEAAARGAGVHPLSVYWMLQSRSAESRWERSLQLERRLMLLTLRQMGHRWPAEIEGGIHGEELADNDGIIPITEGAIEPPLVVRLRRILAEENGGTAFEREFQDAVGKTLVEWLATDFFERHVSQFKKRPFVWQLDSRSAVDDERRERRGVRRTPAFSCFVYYHRLDADLLPKLRTQYVGPLRTSLRTELSSLERLRERSADEDARRLELDGKLEELKAFDARLEHVIGEGFTSHALDKLVANESLDKWVSRDGRARAPETLDALRAQERRYDPDRNDGVRVNIAPLQRADLLASDVLAVKDVESAIADRAEWRADERRWCREGKLQRPGWWRVKVEK